MSDTDAAAAALAREDITEILSEAQLDKLRASFKESTMSSIATSILIAEYPESERYVNAIHDSLFGAGPDGTEPPLAGLSHKERETSLIVLMAAQRTTFELAIHIYWGMMNGLTQDEVAGLLMLCGVYAGIGAQTTGLQTMRQTLTGLKQAVIKAEQNPPEGDVDPLSVAPVLGSILAEFR